MGNFWELFDSILGFPVNSILYNSALNFKYSHGSILKHSIK